MVTDLSSNFLHPAFLFAFTPPLLRPAGTACADLRARVGHRAELHADAPPHGTNPLELIASPMRLRSVPTRLGLTEVGGESV